MNVLDYDNSIQSTIDAIMCWADARNLLDGSNPQAQMLKMTEEVGELAQAISKDESDNISTEIGDCVVVLTILAFQCGLTIEDCVKEAYEKIKDRKGCMVDGIFIKEDDL